MAPLGTENKGEPNHLCARKEGSAQKAGHVLTGTEGERWALTCGEDTRMSKQHHRCDTCATVKGGLSYSRNPASNCRRNNGKPSPSGKDKVIVSESTWWTLTLVAGSLVTDELLRPEASPADTPYKGEGEPAETPGDTPRRVPVSNGGSGTRCLLLRDTDNSFTVEVFLPKRITWRDY